MKKGCKRVFLFVFLALAGFVGFVVVFNVYQSKNPEPTPVPIARKCITEPGMRDKVSALFMEETRIVDGRDVEIEYQITTRPMGETHSEEFKKTAQEFSLRFSALKPGTGKYSKGSFDVMFDDASCTILWVNLRW